MTFKLVVSIINYKTPELILSCVKSVLADLGNVNGHVVIVDNASQDGSPEQIEAWCAQQPPDIPVTLVRSETNTGFSGGHNQGMAAYEADYYLVLNSDAELRPGFLRTVLEAAEAHPDVGLFAPRVTYDDGTVQDSCFRFLSPLGEFVRTARTSALTRLFSGHQTSLGTDPDPKDIEWASFACILLRGQMVQQLGKMDEGYFLYFEDCEYCLRARRAGWGIMHVPQAQAIHFRGGSGPVKSLHAENARLPRYYYSSRTRFLYQAHGLGGVIATNLVWYLGRLIRNAARLTGKRIRPMPKAQWRDIWTNVTQPLGPRYAPGEQE